MRNQMPKTDLDLFRLGFDAAFVDSYELELANGSVVKHAGRFEDNLDGNFPELKWTLITNWAYNNWSANYTARFIDGVKETLTGWYNLHPQTCERRDRLMYGRVSLVF